MNSNNPHLPEGKTLGNGKYRIDRFIGAGGFGCTYEAEFVKMRTRVAIKEFFSKTYCNRDDNGSVYVGAASQVDFVKRLEEKFQREAQRLFKLHHPNIVRVSDILEENNTSYYVMDYIPGKSLKILIQEEGALPEQRVLKYLNQMMDALEYVHHTNMLHLDIKPDNIMIDENDNAILIDFGVSKQYDEDNGHNTSTMMGLTMGFAPIEQVGKCVKRFTPATDIYALGATFYNALTGKTPPSCIDLISDTATLESLPADISETTRQAIESMMQLRLHNRPQTIAEARIILTPTNKAYQDEPALNYEESTDWQQEDCFNESDEDEETTSKKWWWIILGVALILVLAIYLFAGKGCSASKADAADTSATTITVYDTIHTEVAIPSNETHNNRSSQQSQPTQTMSEEQEDQSAEETATINITQPLNGQHNGHAWLDMGTKVKWATCNVGASGPNENGEYFAWGEINTKDTYTKQNSSTYEKEFTDIQSNASYDAATSHWGGGWCLPSKNDFQELIDKCSWAWDGAGYKVTASNGNVLYLPASGSCNGKSLGGDHVYGNYWSSTPNGTGRGWSLCFSKDSHRIFAHDERPRGFSVRAVLK